MTSDPNLEMVDKVIERLKELTEELEQMRAEQRRANGD